MKSSNRILINTVVSYARTLISVVLTLFSSRWVLSELGISDFGIFSLIGTLMVFIMFLNNTLSNSVSRFFAIEIGKGKDGDLSKLFKTALIIHFLFSLLLVFLSFFIGEYLIVYVLSINPDRIDAAVTIYRLSLCSAFVAMAMVPYTASFISYQNIVTVSLLQMVQAGLNFLLALSLLYVSGDKLTIYSLYYCLIQIVIYLLYAIIGMYKYEHCRTFIKCKISVSQIKEILIYTIWNLFGDMGHLFRTQGTSVVVNLLFGTSGNASMGIANQISMQASNLTNSLNSSTAPEIFKRVGEKNIPSAINLACRVNKIGLFFMLIIGIPVIAFIDQILSIWLVEVPAYCAPLCCCFVIMFIIEKLAIGNMVILQAVNNIRKVQLLVFLGYALTPFLPFVGFCEQWNLTGVGISCILTMFLTRSIILWVYQMEFSVDIKDLICRQILPISVLIVVALGYRLKYLHQNDEILLLGTKVIVTMILVSVILFFVMMNKEEQKAIISKFTRIKK